MKPDVETRRLAAIRRGVSWIEVLVVIAIGALLLQIALPWISTGRASARRRHCADNFRRLGLAIEVYHATHGSLPPAVVWTSDGVEDLEELLRSERPLELTRESWAQMLLPYLDEENLASAFDYSIPATDPGNQDARVVRLEQMVCPSDTWNRSDNLYRFSSDDGQIATFARGNYAINGGSQFIYDQHGWLSNPRPNGTWYTYDEIERTFQWWGNGVAGINKAFSFADFDNGLATTVLLNEVRAGIHEIDPRGVWALGQIGSSITWAHGVNGDAYGPNNSIKDSDDIRGCEELHRIVGAELLKSENMPCCDHCPENNQATSRSQHPEGVNVLMADGSVRFVADDVDAGLWHVMHSRITPQEILADGLGERLNGTYASKLAENDQPARPSGAADLSPGETLTNSIGMVFVVVPAGEFTMGLPNKNNDTPVPKEAVAHHVRITQAYLLGSHEVTQDQYELIMGSNPSWHSPQGEGSQEIPDNETSRHPVENVTWYQAVEFCERLSEKSNEASAGRRYRLPTEAEWEYGCRAGHEDAYAFLREWEEGDDSGIIAGKKWKDELYTVPVGSYPPNEFGLHDMCGNVFEWTNDWFALDYYSKSLVDDPPGPAVGYLRVLRGWHWFLTGPNCVANMTTTPWRQNPYVGFRVVCEQSHLSN